GQLVAAPAGRPAAARHPAHRRGVPRLTRPARRHPARRVYCYSAVAAASADTAAPRAVSWARYAAARRSTSGDWVGVVPERGRSAAAVAEARGGVARVEAAGEELAGGVMPSALDVELHPGGICGCSDLVRGPVRVPRPGTRGSLENRYASSRSSTPTAASSSLISSR